ncbi:MAG: polysaccharide biosynthesis tyrosine autokinase [Chloroflexi bacterium]|nr:polysaccharide biosynthesis tyrosine autokinase [Chloroflexota bacterium]
MRPEEYAAIARRRWWLPALCALLAAAVAYVVTASQPVVYEATTRVMAIAAPEKPDQVYWTDLYAKNRLESYRQIATSADIAQAAVERAGLPLSAGELVARTATRHNPSDNTVQLAVRDADPALAARAADALAETLVACLNSPVCDVTPAAPQVKVIRLDRAGVPDQPTGVRPRLNALGGAVLGLTVGALLAVLLEYLDDVLRTPADLQRALGRRLVGRLPAGSGRRGARLAGAGGGEGMSQAAPIAMLAAPQSPLAEAYRVLRTNILFARGEGAPRVRTLLVASVDRESAADVAANLAVATAQAGVATVLVDANLRAPQQHLAFGLANDKGLATALTTDAAATTTPTTVPNLALLPAGPTPATPSELLGSTRLTAILADLATAAELVILDAPPVGTVADAPVLATRVDGVLLVIRSGVTRRARAIEARDELERVGAHIVGVALIEPGRR